MSYLQNISSVTTPRHKTGRPYHSQWDGFSKVYCTNGRCVAKCENCDAMVLNTAKDRLLKHRARCGNLKLPTKIMTEKAIKTEQSEQPFEEITWIDMDFEVEGFRQSSEPNMMGFFYAQCKTCLTIIDAVVEDMRAHRESCMTGPQTKNRAEETVYFEDSCDDQKEKQDQGQKTDDFMKVNRKPICKMKTVVRKAPRTPVNIISDIREGDCANCKKPASRFAGIAKVWERKLDELPLEQALSIEKKMSDMVYEAMLTNIQAQKAATQGNLNPSKNVNCQ